MSLHSMRGVYSLLQSVYNQSVKSSDQSGTRLASNLIGAMHRVASPNYQLSPRAALFLAFEFGALATMTSYSFACRRALPWHVI
jgi:hypothetical protein